MDSDVVTAKLESLRRCIERVRTRTPTSVEELSTDHDAPESNICGRLNTGKRINC